MADGVAKFIELFDTDLVSIPFLPEQTVVSSA